ncbi:fumarylacetoacetate hydrolase family protein [Streptomyces tendae]|uniref:fumarylacetoacetate hydrolase family protein n=1 Tax=Streptomyces tendae TaxID=1932 RepID=UPI002493C3A9|nr:fumarylacetoacetate hydrolase family protein [Streptomyces tendae]
MRSATIRTGNTLTAFRGEGDRAVFFAKFPSTLTGPRDTIALPRVSDHTGGEAELAVIVGQRLRRAGVEKANHALAGHRVANGVVGDARPRLDGAGNIRIPGDLVDDHAHLPYFRPRLRRRPGCGAGSAQHGRG